MKEIVERYRAGQKYFLNPTNTRYDKLDAIALARANLILVREASGALHCQPTQRGLTLIDQLDQGVQPAPPSRKAKRPGRKPADLIDGAWCRALRGELSQEEMMEKLGLSLHTIQRAEAGKPVEKRTKKAYDAFERKKDAPANRQK